MTLMLFFVRPNEASIVPICCVCGRNNAITPIPDKRERGDGVLLWSPEPPFYVCIFGTKHVRRIAAFPQNRGDGDRQLLQFYRKNRAGFGNTDKLSRHRKEKEQIRDQRRGGI